MRGNYYRKLSVEIISGNYQWKLSVEIISGNYQWKLSASILSREKYEIYRDTGISKKSVRL